jgi:hypothetical protein
MMLDKKPNARLMEFECQEKAPLSPSELLSNKK